MKPLYCLLITFLFLTSCSDDDGPSVPTEDFISYQETFYTVSDGLHVGFGTLASGFPPQEGDYPDHFNQDLFLTDGLAHTTESGRAFANHTYIFYIELYSAGSQSFDNGVFTYMNKANVTANDIAGKNWFSQVQWNLVDSEVTYVNLENDIESGTVTVNQQGDSFDLSINIVFKNGDQLRGVFDGDLQKSIYLQKVD